jgi:tetratricopeptide (TPR) repeat protein
MRHTQDVRPSNIGLIGWIRRGISVLIILPLMSGISRAGESQPHVAAAELQRRGDLIGAEKVLQSAVKEARATGSRSLQVAGALAALGVFYQDIGRFSQAESSFTSSLKILREATGPEDPALAPLVIRLTWLYVETGRAGEASRLHPESWVDRLTLLEPDSKFLPTLLETLAGLNALQGRFTAARDIYRKNFDLLVKRGADVSVEMASALNNAGFIQLRARRYSEALNDLSEALKLWTLLADPDDLQVAISRLGLAKAHISLGRHHEAGELLQQALPVFERKCGRNSLRTEDVLSRYAQVLRHEKRGKEAKKLEERARLIRGSSVADASFKHVINVWDVGETGIAPESSSNLEVRPPSVPSLERRAVFVPR